MPRISGWPQIRRHIDFVAMAGPEASTWPDAISGREYARRQY
jgi:hypothetical protein